MKMDRNKKIWLLISWFCILLIFLFIFLGWNKVSNKGKVKKKIKSYIEYKIPVKGKEIMIKIGDKKKLCFVSNTWYKLLTDNIIEKQVLISNGTFTCLKNKFKIKQYKQKKWDYIVDNKWVLHILKSNVSLNVKWIKIYWQ